MNASGRIATLSARWHVPTGPTGVMPSPLLPIASARILAVLTAVRTVVH